MKEIFKIILFSVSAFISCVCYAGSPWYALDYDPESAATDGFHWRKKCTAATEYNNPASMIEEYKMLEEPYSFSVRDVKEGGVIVQTTITRIYKKDQKFNLSTTWYRGKERCERLSLKERMAIERDIEAEKKKRMNEDREVQRIRDRYK
jgi:hypothetical protein